MIIYDIVDNKRRVKFAKFLEGYGKRVQKSAFEAMLSSQRYEKMVREIPKYIELKDNEDKKEEINVICNQIVDLALLANKELNAEELDLFIKRSNSLMSKVISL